MSPRRIRALIIVVFVGGIAGMIVGSIQDDNALAMTFGAITALCALALILISAVTGPEAFDRPVRFDESAAAELEARVATLVDDGADEATVRDLVRHSVRLGAAARGGGSSH
jgi:hypothetical protein